MRSLSHEAKIGGFSLNTLGGIRSCIGCETHWKPWHDVETACLRSWCGIQASSTHLTKLRHPEKDALKRLDMHMPQEAGNRRRWLACFKAPLAFFSGSCCTLSLVASVRDAIRLGARPLFSLRSESAGVLERNKLQSLSGIVAATSVGDVRRFNKESSIQVVKLAASQELEQQEELLIAQGTYLVVAPPPCRHSDVHLRRS